jgi:hypothetical protein
MVMFSEDVNELDFDVEDVSEDAASLYPSSPELGGARTSVNLLREQVRRVAVAAVVWRPLKKNVFKRTAKI